MPDEKDTVEKFYRETLVNISPENIMEWDVSNFGYITWKDIESFCVENQLLNSRKVFKHNTGQIY